MDIVVKMAIETEKMMSSTMSSKDLDRVRKDLQNLINYTIKLEKRLDNIINPQPQKYY